MLHANMDSLIKAAESFDQADFNDKTFLKFMQQVAIWDYFGLSKNEYVALPESEKRTKIYQYYIDMQQKNTVGEFCYLFICLLVVNSFLLKVFLNLNCLKLFGTI